MGRRKRILVSVYSSSFGISMLALGIVAALEIFMLVYTIINPALYGGYIGRYRGFYAALLAVSLLCVGMNLYVRGDIERRCGWLSIVYPASAAFFFAWAAGVTINDAIVLGAVDMTVFMTFSLMVPLSFYMTPLLFGIIAALADATVVYAIFAFSGSIGQVINASIFIIFQLVLGVSFMLLKGRLAERIVLEQENAELDVMTGFGNRRSYVKALKKYASPLEPGLSYIAIDINGLKEVNDKYGHDAGDNLIIGAAHCIEACFGECARMYRIGGDEFAVLSTAGDIDGLLAAYERSMRLWSDGNSTELTASYGYASVHDNPGASITELARIADEKMYASKALYYRRIGKDRRRPRN